MQITISGGKMEGVHAAPHDIENPKDPLQEELDNLYTKKRYLRVFLRRTGVSFSDYIQMIKEKEGRLRGCYAEPIEFGSDEFVRIVLVDVAFVIEFLLRNYSSDYRQDEDDYIFNKPQMLCDVRPDLRLLENQLPFFILQDLFKKLFPSSHQLPSFLEISNYYFESEINRKGKEKKFKQICSSGEEVQHFVDLIRILYLPVEPKPEEGLNSIAVPNVTELVQAGVQFRVRTDSSDLFYIKFSDVLMWCSPISNPGIPTIEP
ncbi:hypothetical protein D8674_014938 [Pyrus ussuriensis x Pyrus communis]|uniref:Uncharacterized protein n=1 Tax=Pyrus ussuriensis x Pyrus communis TaxID=2448454 RepID=A0A5N5GTY5_9ROSA|nr:hypothetical protein D8674_014938 [Pyrus ussuriensis x Pyrus communis]